MKRRLRAPSPAFVISLIALFVALGGTTYAATSLPTNSVGTAQLKNGAVTDTKVAKKLIVFGAKAAVIAGVALNAQHASSADTATTATNADTATSATNANTANTAANATRATNAGFATSADFANNAMAAASANHATTADSATNAGFATNAGDAVTVNGYGPSDLTNFANVEQPSSVSNNTLSTVASLQITAARSGHVLVNADVTILNADSTVDLVRCNVNDGGAYSVPQDGVLVNTTADGRAGNVSTTGVFPVNQGVQTINVNCEREGTGNAALNVEASAAFSPFSY